MTNAQRKVLSVALFAVGTAAVAFLALGLYYWSGADKERLSTNMVYAVLIAFVTITAGLYIRAGGKP